MISLLAVLLFSFGVNVYAMHSASEYANLARNNVALALKASDATRKEYVRRAGLNTARALQNNPNGLTDELLVYKAFVCSVQTFQQNKCDEALASCVDIINGPMNTSLLKNVRLHAWQMVQALADKKQHTVSRFYAQTIQSFEAGNCDEALSSCVDIIHGNFQTPILKNVRWHAWEMVKSLADEKKHTVSRFYFMKHLLNAKSQEYIEDGLNRFDALLAHNIEEEDYQALSILFKHSGVLSDIKKLADAQGNPHAQCIMARYHVLLAERGKEMDGTPTEPRSELSKACAYAQKSVAGHYNDASVFLARIETALKKLQDERLGVISSGEGLPVVASLRKVAPLKVLCTVELYKKSLENDHRQLYFYGKKLLDDPDDLLYASGLGYLKKSAQLGNPFAAERLGDELRESDPERAGAYYFQALNTYKRAKGTSYYRQLGCFKRSGLEWKLSVLAEKAPELGQYRLACEYGQSAAREQWVFGIYNKNHIDALAAIVHALEKKYIEHKHTVDELFLKMIVTSGVWDFFELFKEHTAIQDVLINVFALRGHIGRGYVLQEETQLAHYKKALHFILDPKAAQQESLNAQVPDEILLKKINIDALPVQQRILYLECMLGVVEQRLQVPKLSSKEAQYICAVFSCASAAIIQTQDTHLKQLHRKRYFSLLEHIVPLAIEHKVRDVLVPLAHSCVTAYQEGVISIAVLERADELYTMALQLKSGKNQIVETTQEIQKRLAHVKILRAQALGIQEDIQHAHRLYKQALQYVGGDIDMQWQYAQFLMESGQIDLRTKGLGIIERLAYTHRHRQAMVYMLDGYLGNKPHVITRDDSNAFSLLQQLIQIDPPEYPVHRLLLAKLYLERAALGSQGHYQKKLIATAQDLVRPYKNTHNSAHMLYIDILCALDREREVVRELQTYKGASSLSESDLLELAKGYAMRADGQKDQSGSVLRAKAFACVEKIKDSSDEAYLLFLNVLLEQGYFDQLRNELAVERARHLACVRECFFVRSLLLQRRAEFFEQVLEHSERAFGAFEDQFLRTAAQDTQKLSDLIASVGVSECVFITHPMKETSLSHLEKVVELLSLVIIEGKCPDAVRERMLLYTSFFSVKIALLRLGHVTTYDDVLRLLGKTVDVSVKVSDISCKIKILELISYQIHFWLETTSAGSLAIRAKTATSLLMMCAKVCKNVDDALLSQQFHDIVVYTDRMAQAVDLAACPPEDLVTIRLQQQIVARIMDTLKKK